MSKQEKKLVVTVGGRLLYPKKKGETLNYALEMSKLTEAKLLEMVKAEFPNDTLTIKPDKKSGLPLLNVKSNYDIKVFDKDKNEINEHSRTTTQSKMTFAIAALRKKILQVLDENIDRQH